MARKPKAAASLAPQEMSFDPDALYRIRVARCCEAAGTMFRPGAAKIVVKGRVAEEIKEHLANAEPA
jgi:hypothetical protein